ncbi:MULTISPECIES: protease inhibitor I42 family protein [Acidobacteriaceae]|uniref:protease inhibitor I42 family protein n=1 Tax=Acidobacteriaceae TaxID=204434 RepID=UPI00131BFE3F|nr:MULTISPECIES: protease inhibitor I42 family protein [Acidobacteriaceae]MDW5267299.1 protease inhibitor I42 family protein [Edaphobacter sp.]
MSETQLPDHLDLQVNQETSIVLPSAGLSGYVWQLQQSVSSSVAEAALRRESVDASGAGIGRAAPEKLVIHATAPGKLTLNLALRRPWERDAAPLQIHTLEVNVT